MQKYDQEYFAKVRELLQIKAQELANEHNESTTSTIDIEILDEVLQFTVAINIEDYYHEEETNFTEYKVEIFVDRPPMFENNYIYNCFLHEFFQEQIY